MPPPIGKNPPATLNVNIQIKPADLGAASGVQDAQAKAEVQAPRSLGGRAVKLIADVTKWAFHETSNLLHKEVQATVRDVQSAASQIKQGAVYVAHKFSEGIHTLHEKHQAHQAEKKALKSFQADVAQPQVKLTSARQTRDGQTSGAIGHEARGDTLQARSLAFDNAMYGAAELEQDDNVSEYSPIYADPGPNDPASSQVSDVYYQADPTPTTPQPSAPDIEPYATGQGDKLLDYTNDASLKHLKPTAQFVKAEINQHGTDAGRALQNIGVLKVLGNRDHASNGEILQAITPKLQEQYRAELTKLKAERETRSVAQNAATDAYRASSLDHKDLNIHSLLQSPVFSGAPLATRFLENAYLDIVDQKHARGDAKYDRQQPSQEIAQNKYLQRDALALQFGTSNPDSAISKALAKQGLSPDALEVSAEKFQTQLKDATLALILSPDGLKTSTADFAARVDAMVAEHL
jgi:hypothetical protein